MKNIKLIPSAILTAASVAAFSMSAFAQVPSILKGTKSVVRTAQMPVFTEHAKVVRSIRSANELKYVPAYNASFLQAPYKGAIRPAPPANALTRTPAVPTPTAGASAQGILEQTEKRIQSAILFRQRQQRLTWMVDISRVHDEILAGFHLPENFIEAYYFRRIMPYLAEPSYTPEKNSDFLYRGMLLTLEDLSKILRTGFSPASSTWNTGTDGRPAVSLSSSITEATHYIFQQGFKKDAVGVVFEVRRRPAMVPGQSRLYNSTGTIYYSYENISADDIVNVYLRGEYSLESLADIVQKAKEGKITPHEKWTGQFDGMFSR